MYTLIYRGNNRGKSCQVIVGQKLCLATKAVFASRELTLDDISWANATIITFKIKTFKSF